MRLQTVALGYGQAQAVDNRRLAATWWACEEGGGGGKIGKSELKKVIYISTFMQHYSLKSSIIEQIGEDSSWSLISILHMMYIPHTQ